MSNNERDRFNVEKIFHTKEDGEEWFMDHDGEDELRDDERVQNWRDDEGVDYRGDKVWQATGGDNGQFRLEVWSPRRGNEEQTRRARWLNVEITAYCRVREKDGNPPYAWQLYCRGGHHSSNNNGQCEGSALKGRWFNHRNNEHRGNQCSVVKEICHPAYSSNTATRSIDNVEDYGNGDWYGAKLVVWNDTRGDRTLTKMEVWTDPGDRTNNWRKVTEYVDDGDWYVDEEFTVNDRRVTFDEWCGDCHGGRRRNEILKDPGGKDNRNCVALRTDDETLQFKFLSCREIDPDRRIHG